MDKNIKTYFERYFSDKGEQYSDIYNEICYPKRNDKINLLEIGIGTLNPTKSNMIFWKNKYDNYLPGASLRAFRDYFLNGEIYGIDIQEDCMIEEERIHTFLIDSRDKTLCEKYLGNIKFDFIIDDGDHTYSSQIETFHNLFKLLKPTGIYVLEDLEAPNFLKEYFKRNNYNFEFREKLILIKP